MNVPQEKGKVVPTELTVVAHKQLEEAIAADMNIPDPTDEQAEAVLRGDDKDEVSS